MFKFDQNMLSSLLVCLFYGLTSMSMGLLNKVLLSTFSFHGIFLLLTLQMVFQIIFCEYTRDKMGNPLNVPQYDWKVHRAGLMLGILYIVNVSMGLIGLSLVNLPMFFCIRRLVAPTIVFYEFILYNKKVDSLIQKSIVVMVIGALLAGLNTLSTDVLGYGLTMLNNLTTAATSVSQKRFSEKEKVGAAGVLYYNALTALPLSAVLCIVWGEIGDLFERKVFPGYPFFLTFFGCCILGPILTYASMLCTTYNSPLAMSITGTVKDLSTTTLGALIFPGFIPTLQNVTGLVLTFIGAGMYSTASLRKSGSHFAILNSKRLGTPPEKSRGCISEHTRDPPHENIHISINNTVSSRRHVCASSSDRDFDPEDV